MSRPKSVFACNECGAQAPKWTGQCPSCGAWNSLIESVVTRAPGADRNARFSPATEAAGSQPLQQVSMDGVARMNTGLAELDRVLGGGLIAGSVVLIGGDPGIGKSTLLLQALAALSKCGPVLYVTGEESTQQVAMRAIGWALNRKSTSSRSWCAARSRVVDSIQTVYTDIPVRTCRRAVTVRRGGVGYSWSMSPRRLAGPRCS